MCGGLRGVKATLPALTRRPLAPPRRAPKFNAGPTRTRAMSTHTTDTHVLAHITALIAEEENLHAGGDRSLDQDRTRARIAAIEVELDQYWDLLRRRRALREFGKNPDEADMRSAKTVEKYEG